MSGIAGIIHFDGRPVEPGPIEKMTGAMAHRGLPQERLGTDEARTALMAGKVSHCC